MKKILETEINKDTNTTFYLKETKMIYTIVSVKDRALNAYGRPVFVHTQGQAIRSFQDEINRSDNQNEMNKHPDDFDLYFVGTFDDTKGEFNPTSDPLPIRIAIGKQMKIQKE